MSEPHEHEPGPGPERAPRPSGAGESLIGWIIGPVFVACALWFLLGPQPGHVPLADRVPVDPASLGSEPMRAPLPEPATLRVAGFDKKCMECHSLFRLNRAQPLLLSQHRNIVQGHGMNDRCFNCHAGDDPSRLALPDGATIAFADAARLCATCHGPAYRDWEAGMHGRSTGSWDTASEARGRLTCTACHDPHAPAFGPMSILPGPNTLRLEGPRHDVSAGHGAPTTPHPAGGGRRNPLRQWSGGGKDEP